MRIFSSFDTSQKGKLIAEKEKEFGPQRVHCIKRSRFFLMIKVIYPIMVSLLVGLGVFLCFKYWFDVSIFLSFIIAAFTALIMSFLYKITKHYIDYTMDYCIITPQEVIFTEQSGFFKKQITSINTDKIKSINTEKGGFFKSIFNDGNIVFTFLDIGGAADNRGEIYIDHVYSPERHRLIITGIINENK